MKNWQKVETTRLQTREAPLYIIGWFHIPLHVLFGICLVSASPPALLTEKYESRF